MFTVQLRWNVTGALEKESTYHNYWNACTAFSEYMKDARSGYCTAILYYTGDADND